MASLLFSVFFAVMGFGLGVGVKSFLKEEGIISKILAGVPFLLWLVILFYLFTQSALYVVLWVATGVIGFLLGDKL